jgi:hypothetical protein
MKSFRPKAPVAMFWLSLTAGAMLGTSCSETGTRVTDSGMTITTGGALPDLIRARNERKRGPMPESEWNYLGMWKKINNQPPTFIPKQHPETAPRTPENGQWFIDHRDGKRLYVPNYVKGPLSSQSSLLKQPASLIGSIRRGNPGIAAWITGNKSTRSTTAPMSDPPANRFFPPARHLSHCGILQLNRQGDRGLLDAAVHEALHQFVVFHWMVKAAIRVSRARKEA